MITVDLVESSASSWAEVAPLFVKTADDPLALSCAVHRQWQQDHTRGRWAELGSVTATDQDRTKAQEIRRYYRDRIMMDVLRGRTAMSEFRKKLYGFVANDTPIAVKDIGLLYRLPYFYDEDVGLDRVTDCTKSVTSSVDTRTQICLQPLETILRSRRGADYVQFWMTSDHSPCAYLLTIRSTDPYQRLLTGLLQKPVTVDARLYPKPFQGYHQGRFYYLVNDIELVQ